MRAENIGAGGESGNSFQFLGEKGRKFRFQGREIRISGAETAGVRIPAPKKDFLGFWDGNFPIQVREFSPQRRILGFWGGTFCVLQAEDPKEGFLEFWDANFPFFQGIPGQIRIFWGDFGLQFFPSSGNFSPK